MDSWLDNIRGRRAPTDVVALDLASSSTKLVRLKKSKDHVTLVGAELLPRQGYAGPDGNISSYDAPLVIPKALKARRAALAHSGPNAVLRLLSLRENLDKISDSRLLEQLGLDDSYRVGYAGVDTGKSKSETRLLAVGFPDEEVKRIIEDGSRLPATPVSVEVSGLAALNAFQQSMTGALAQEAVAFIESGARVTVLGIFNKGVLVLVRKFALGGDTISERVCESLRVERDVARQIVADGSFDISQAVKADINPFLRQLSISRDFVERHEDCNIQTLYLSGGMSLSAFWTGELHKVSGMATRSWDPFEALHKAEGAVTKNAASQAPRFAAAIGAGLGLLGEASE